MTLNDVSTLVQQLDFINTDVLVNTLPLFCAFCFHFSLSVTSLLSFFLLHCLLLSLSLPCFIPVSLLFTLSVNLPFSFHPFVNPLYIFLSLSLLL